MADKKRFFDHIDKDNILHTDQEDFQLTKGLADNVRKHWGKGDPIGIDTGDDGKQVKSVRSTEWRKK